MPQSYKTICSLFVTAVRQKFLFLLLLFTAASSLAETRKPTAGNQRFNVLYNYEHRFTIPPEQADLIWQYVAERYQTPNLPRNFTSSLQTRNIIDLYFDDELSNLRYRQMALRQRLFISGQGRKQHLQLLYPKKTGISREIIFKPNSKPDKGRSFTTHPLLKLVRTKDRPALDSMLQQFKIKPAELTPAIEITEREESLNLRYLGADWVTISFVEFHSENPEYVYAELQIRPDRKQFTAAQPPQQLKLKQSSDTLASHLQKKFPELKPETRTVYTKMIFAWQKKQPELTRTKALFGAALLLGMWLLFFLRKQWQKHLKK